MILFKYSKTGLASFIPHLDMIRHIERILFRAKIDINFSQGYNRHSLIYLSNPIMVGLESYAEYCVIDSNYDISVFAEKFNAAAPSGIKCLKAKFTSKNPNLMAIAQTCEYEISGNYPPVVLPAELFITDKKGIQKEIRAKIRCFEQSADKINAVLPLGNDNVRIDYFVNALEVLTGVKGYAIKTGIAEIEKLFS